MERCRTDDLMPNVPISCLPPSRVDRKVQGLKVIIDCRQRSYQATYRPPPLSRWSKCGSNKTVMVLVGSGNRKVSKKLSRSDLTQPDTGEQLIIGLSSHYFVSSVSGKCKGKRSCMERVNGTPSHSYGVSLAISDHTVLPATRHK